MTKIEKTICRFKCDYCGELSEDFEQPLTYPYRKGWIYLRGFKAFKIKEGEHHFCSKSCFINYIGNRIKDAESNEGYIEW